MQEVFDFHKIESLNWNDFIDNSTNHDAIMYLSQWPNWMHQGVIIYGDHGVGKTHLAALWAQSANAVYILRDSFWHPPRDLFQYNCNFVLDNFDFQTISENEDWLFHFFNIAVEQKRNFLILSLSHPSDWPVRLRDLKSRFNTLPVVGIARPDDALLMKIAKKISKDFDIFISDDALEYILSVIPRDVKEVAYNLQMLDKLSLRLHKPLNLPFVKRYIVPKTLQN